MKTCTKCGLEKELSEFYKKSAGTASQCKVCMYVARKRYREANKEVISARTKVYREANKDVLLVRNKAYREANKEAIAVRQRRKVTGFEPAHVEAALALQAYRCAICGVDLAVLPSRQIHADHCHITGLQRGLLCNSCNNGLGRFKDDPNRLLAAIKYLLHPPLAGAQLA